jgi:hypothetical protein
LQALFEQAAALRGQSVLIHGAAGSWCVRGPICPASKRPGGGNMRATGLAFRPRSRRPGGVHARRRPIRVPGPRR